MIHDSGASLLISNTEIKSSLPTGILDAAKEILLDRDSHFVVVDDARSPSSRGTLHRYHPAYVIYTSGSTGAPKGVVVQQQGLLNHVVAKVSALSIQVEDRLAQTASQCFDISVWQFLAPLVAGARIIIVEGAKILDPLALKSVLINQRVTIFETVPSLLQAICSPDSCDEFPALRWLLVTGEACATSLAQHWAKSHSGTALVNAYGPTECSDDVTHHFIDDFKDRRFHTVPIGRSLPNTRLYVLDELMCPVPVGSKGELYVGGAGLSRGYINRPGLTAERFVADPFRTGERLYRTGDLCRWRQPGLLEYLGRIDQQVKIRGFRIELGEIEAVLRTHSDVAQAVVVASEARNGEKQLVAYVVSGPGANLVPSKLREFIEQRLPRYMVPAAVMPLKEVPVTRNGKVDRQALPEPEFQPASVREPVNTQEKIVKAIFAELLQFEDVGMDDDFFDLGGHSLLATRLISRLRKSFGVDLPIRTLFEYPTVAGISAAIEKEFLDRLSHLSDEQAMEMILSSGESTIASENFKKPN
jgi:amino acid adenylation domain-containing protein